MNNSFNDLTSEQIEEIKRRFHELRSREDFYALLTELLDYLQFEEEVNVAYLQWIKAFVNFNYPRKYNHFIIKKASGKDRIIHAPNQILKFVQRLFNIVLNTLFTAHPSSFGFKRSSSILDNAQLHVNYNYVYNIDIIDFFSTIDYQRTKRAFEKAPFNLTGPKAELAHHLALLSCINLKVITADGTVETIANKKVLPQGAPTSPTISNIVCFDLDNQLLELATKFKVNYSRYADDITFSSNKNVYQENSRFIASLQQIIHNYGFKINQSKTRLQRKHTRQVVTGLVVNEKANINRQYIKTLKMYIYYCEKYGYQKAELLYNNDINSSLFGGEPKSLFNLIKGRIDFLKMVKGKEDRVYRQLAGRWNKLTNPDRQTLELRAQYFNAHKPKDVAAFLRLFQDSAGLKYLTHDFDVPVVKFNYEHMIDLANKDLNAGYQKYALTRSLYARVKQFAFMERPNWWRWIKGQKITYRMGWKSAQLVQWVKENPGVHPIRSKLFRDELIMPFKESIQIRAPKLKSLIEDSIKEKFLNTFSEFDITLENLESAEFYTDVDLVLGGIRHLLDGMAERIEISNKIHIEFKREEIGDHYFKIITLTHINSFCFKEARASDLLNGNFVEAKKLFNGLCNWSITSAFADGPFRLYMLNDDPNTPEREQVDPNELFGFTHSLYFY